MSDQMKHILAGLGTALAVAFPVWLSSLDLFAGLWGCLSGVIAGGVKEWCDNNAECGHWDWKDFGWTCLGVIVAELVILIFHFAKG